MPDASRSRAVPRSIYLALLTYAAFIVYQSLAAGGAWVCRGPVLDVAARLSRTDVLANVLAYIPLGMLLSLAGARGVSAGPSRTRSRVGGALAGIAGLAVLSTVMEVVQACQSARVSSAWDVLANVTGGAVGIVAGLMVTTWSAGVARTPDRRTIAPLPVDRPWPGRIPPPAPATVLPEPEPVQVHDAAGDEVLLDGREGLAGDPAWVRWSQGRRSRVSGWAGPWVLTGRWWGGQEPRAHLQVAFDDEPAALLVATSAGWACEARYD